MFNNPSFFYSVLADENAKVNAAISQGVRSTESSYSSSQIRSMYHNYSCWYILVHIYKRVEYVFW